jgi:uncharacterized protein (TIGR03435 family)
MRRLFRIAFAIAVMFTSGAVLFAQTPAKPKPAFEVVTIKPVGPFQIRPGIRISGNRFDCAMSLEGLITTAYQIKTDQMVGPDWLNSQRFAINATIPEGSSKDQVPGMLQALLEDRFKLKAHLEKKDQPVYALVVAKKEDLKLMKADETVYADAKPLSPTHPMSIKREGDSVILIDSRTGMVTSGRSGGSAANGMMRVEILRTSMPAFVDYITPLTDRPVIDATDLKGSYKMTLELPIEVYRNSIMNRPIPADLASALGTTPFSPRVREARLRTRPPRTRRIPPAKHSLPP